MNKREIYKCPDCDDVLEVIGTGKCDCGAPACCGKEMILKDEKTKEGAGEKHLPVVEDKGGSVLVKVGSVEHPMDADHWIQVIEVITKSGIVMRKELNPGEKPEALFPVPAAEVEQAREFCNKHGLWAV